MCRDRSKQGMAPALTGTRRCDDTSRAQGLGSAPVNGRGTGDPDAAPALLEARDRPLDKVVAGGGINVAAITVMTNSATKLPAPLPNSHCATDRCQR